MKKRILAFLLSMVLFCMTAATSAFAAETKGLDALKDFNFSFDGVDSISMYLYMEMEVDSDGESMVIEVDGTISEVIRSETDIDMEIDMTAGFMGILVPMQMYYKDGAFYFNAMEQKIKMPLPLDELMSQMQLEDTEAFDFEFPEEIISNIEIEEVEDGTSIYFAVDGYELASFVFELMETYGETLDIGQEMYFDDFYISAFANKDNFLEAMELEFGIEVVDQGEYAYIGCYMYMEVLQIGDVVIEFPDDLDTYIEEDDITSAIYDL